MKSDASCRPHVLRWTMPLLAVLLASGCSEGGGSGTEAIVIPRDAIEVLGTSDALSRVRDLVRGADGTTWILNDAPPFFIAFGSDGEVLVEHGERGEGPEEFQAPVALASSWSGSEAASVWVYDRGRHAMRRIDGGEGASVSFPRDEVAPGRLLSVDDGGLGGSRAWVRGTPGGFLAAASSDAMTGMARSLWDAELILLTHEGTIANRLPVSERVGDPDARYPGALILLPFPLWDRCADGTTVLYAPLDNVLVRLAPDGEPGPAVSLPPQRDVRLTADRLYGILVPRMMQEVPAHARPPDDELRASFDEEFDEASAQFAEVFPEYAAMHCADDGGIWLQPFDADEGMAGHGADWWRIEPWGDDDGSPRITAVRLPPSFTPFRFEANRAWGVVLDDLDVPSVASIELP